MNKQLPLVSTAIPFLLMIIGILIFLTVPFVQAGALITVNDVNDLVLAGDSLCTLREAVENANTDSDTTLGDCAAGSGADTITFLDQPGSPDIYEVGASLLVTDGLTIAGLGQDETSIQAHVALANSIFVVMVVSGDVVTFEELTIRAAHATGKGGGVLNQGSIVIFVNSTLRDNMASLGGGLFNDGGNVTFDHSTISNNTASSQGGGIVNTAFGTITFRESTVSQNTSVSDGGGIFNEDGSLTLIASTVDNNTADSGGGILNGGTLTMTNSTVSGNFAGTGSGGGLFNAGGLAGAAINNSTFSENQAVANGNALHNEEALTLSQSIMADSFPGDVCSGSILPVSLGYNLDSDGTCNLTLPTDIPSGNANLDVLKNNGGPTETHALLPNSEAIDRISGAFCPPPATDQRGFVRPLDGNNDDTIACDIGSFELGPLNFLPLVMGE